MAIFHTLFKEKEKDVYFLVVKPFLQKWTLVCILDGGTLTREGVKNLPTKPAKITEKKYTELASAYVCML